MKEHTPGPWEVREVAFGATPFNDRRVYRVEIRHQVGPGHSRMVCQIIDYCDWTDHPANARLIAAAPDMLEALKHAAKNMPHPDQMIDDAIAKATA